MADEKQGQQSGKPNKFDEQNKGAEDRKAADTQRQGQPSGEPAKESDVQTDKGTQNK